MLETACFSPTPSYPLWITMSMDFIVELTCSQGYTTILVVVDLFIKMAQIIPFCAIPIAPEMACFFLERVFHYHRLPRRPGTSVNLQFLAGASNAPGHRIPHLIYIPSAHQLANRMGQPDPWTIPFLLLNYHQDDWVSLLLYVESVYDNASNQQSPFFPMMGFIFVFTQLFLQSLLYLLLQI